MMIWILVREMPRHNHRGHPVLIYGYCHHPVETHSRASLHQIHQTHNQPHGRTADDHVANNFGVETHSGASLRGDVDGISIRGARDGYGVAFREPKSISSFVGGFKALVTTRINTLRQTKGQKVWQYRFHDHVIRDYEECRRIGAYIDSNIVNWKDDRYYKP